MRTCKTGINRPGDLHQLNSKKMKEVAGWPEPFRQNRESRFTKLDKVLNHLKNKK
jgi:hypothetical protein